MRQFCAQTLDSFDPASLEIDCDSLRFAQEAAVNWLGEDTAIRLVEHIEGPEEHLPRPVWYWKPQDQRWSA